MKKFGNFICKNKYFIMIVSFVLLILSIIGMNLTKINYDILVYLPNDIDTIKGQDILVNDFNMGSYSIAVANNMNGKDILKLEDKIRKIDGVNEVISLYDASGTSIPVEMLPSEITDKLHKDNSDLILITFNDSTSSEKTISAVKEIRSIANKEISVGGMSSMVLDTMNLSEKEITIYILIAVILCIIVLMISLDSYVVPFLLLINIGCAIVFNMGSNVFLGQISYITKALVAVLQLGVTTDFSIFLYHSYEKKKKIYSDRNDAMTCAIKETFTSVTGSSLTTIVGFIALCAMELTLGKDLGIVMAKGVLLGVITVLTLFPSLLLIFDKLIEKTKHKEIMPNFNSLNKFIIKHYVTIFTCFVVLFIPIYLANSKVDVYYKLDSSLPVTLESVKTNEVLKEDYNIVSPEIVLVDKNLKNDSLNKMIKEIEDVDGIDFVLSFNDLNNMGITSNMISKDITEMFLNDKYQMILVNSVYDIATDELNNQVEVLNNIVKKYDKNSIVAGEGALMKDLVEISDTDFKNVNTYSIVCIFLVLFFVLKSISLPILLILVIEFAIFINMSISYFGGSTLPFIAPIVLGTIQLGATIDYAILMTTNYLERRRNGVEKKDAMLDVLNYCGTSILISGMCFFASTFGVGLYSDIEMIGSLCTLISRGALISMAIVIMVLPSTLLIFDKFILKTTLKTKGGNVMKNVKNISKKVGVMGLIVTILISSPVYALTKNETVYSKLNTDGSIKNVIVNEHLINSSDKDYVDDYSELKDILNINDDSDYEENNNNLTWNAYGNDIFYQGTTSKSLPISAKVTYMLDGKVKNVNEMLGKEGNVTIKIKYINNDKHGTLYTPFVVTMGTIIDLDNNSNISINNGKVVSNGSKNIVIGIAAPGLYESLNLDELKNLDTITINYDTDKFELSSIYQVVTPKLLESSDLELFDKLDKVYSNVNELKNGMNSINKGANKLKDGSSVLKNTLKDKMNSLDNKSDALTEEQVLAIKNGSVNSIKNYYTDAYKNAIGDKAWERVKESLNSDNDTIRGYVESSTKDALNSYLLKGKEYCDSLDKESISDEELAICNAFQSEKMIELVKDVVASSNAEVANKSSYYTALVTSKNVASQVSEETALNIAGIVSEQVSKDVANSVKEVSTNEVKKSLNSLYNGIDELDNGINELTIGIEKFDKEGISKISNLVNSNVKTISNKIKTLTKLGEDYSSFGGKTNSSDGETKFILVIDGVKSNEQKVISNKDDNKTTFWDRIKNLF